MSFLGGYRPTRLGFGPSAELMRPRTPMQRNLFIHEAYGPRIDAGTEFFAVVPMDADGNVLSANVIAEGAEGAVDFDYYDIERVMRRAGPRAVKFFMAHNHPSGDSRPSKEDNEATVQVIELLKSVGGGRWELDDHLITTASENVFSSIRVRNPSMFGDPEEEWEF